MGFLSHRHRGQAGQSADEQSVDIFAQNVQTVADLVARREARLSRGQRFIEDLTSAIGRPRFLYINLLFIAAWVFVNSILFPQPLDAPPFFWMDTILATESILITGMVLISQNRQRQESERRSQLDLQINLLSEQKITKILTMLEQILEEQTQKSHDDPEITAMQESADPELLLTALEFAMDQATVSPNPEPVPALSPEEAAEVESVQDALEIAHQRIETARSAGIDPDELSPVETP